MSEATNEPLSRLHIDAEKKVVSADLDEAEWAKHGVLAKYARLVGSAAGGAVCG